MGIFGTIAKPVTGPVSFFSANRAMGGIRQQLRSYEGKQLFDSKRLNTHFAMYAKIKRRLMKYRVKKKGESIISTYVQTKIYNKYKRNPEKLKKVLLREIIVLSNYYAEFLRVVSAIKMDEADLVLQENSGIIKNQQRMTALIRRIPKTDAAIMGDDLNEFKKEVKNLAKEERKDDRKEYRWRQQLSAGGRPAKKAMRRAGGFFGRMMGVNYITHKIFKLSKRISTKTSRKFNEEFTKLQNEINSRKVNPVTISNLRVLMRDYEKIRKYYFDIDRDIVLLIGKLFEDFDIVLNECIIPFYAEVKEIPAAQRIVEETNRLKESYTEMTRELQTEELEIRRVNQQLNGLVRACNDAIGNVEQRNNEVIAHLQQQMAIRPQT